MDDDIRKYLNDLGNHVHSIARQLESTKVTPEALDAVSECLTNSAECVDTIVRVQKLRTSA